MEPTLFPNRADYIGSGTGHLTEKWSSQYRPNGIGGSVKGRSDLLGVDKRTSVSKIRIKVYL